MNSDIENLALSHAEKLPENISPEPNNSGERLHSFSWLFVLIAQLWNLIVPLTLVLVAGRMSKDDGWETFFALLAAFVLSAYSLFYSLTFRFWVATDEMIVKEGLFNRTLRHVPFTRIQNVAFRQSLLHRLFGVVELNLESGAGAKPEAKLTVLTMARARQLEQEIRGSTSSAKVPKAPHADTQSPTAAIPGMQFDAHASTQLLHQVPLFDLVRFGLISNRGMVAIGAAFYFLSQTKLLPTNVFKEMARWLKADIGLAHGPFFWLLSGLITLAMILVVVRLASIVMAIFSFYDFKLFAEADRLRVEHGLTTRQGGATKPSRIVCFLLRDGLLYRWFNRQSAEVVLPGNLASEGGGNGPKGMRYLSPMATPEQANALIELASGVDLKDIELQPLHARAWKRMVKWPLLIVGWLVLVLLLFLALKGKWLAGLGLAFSFSGFSKLGMAFAHSGIAGTLLALTYIAFATWMVYAYKRNAAASGFALTPTHLIIRSGYFSQCSHIVPRGEIQSVTLSQSPFDRRSQMANVHVDLAAGSALETPEASVHYLPEAVARELAAALRANQLIVNTNQRSPVTLTSALSN